MVATAGLLTACAGGGGGEGGDDITIQFSSTQAESAPNFYCGMELFKDRIEEKDLGITVDLYPSSQLGPDAERVAGLQAGDSDMDLQEAGLASVYPQAGILGAAYVFDDVDHAFDWFDNDSEEFRASFNEETGLTIIDGWYYGTRTFSAKEPIRSPEDLRGMQIRFPDTPQYLANAEAMGANAVAVASEEVYVALQQGIADGQENPVVGTKSESYDELLDYVSLNDHQLSIHWVTIADQTLDAMTEEQREAVFETVKEIRPENRECVEQETQEILDEWKSSGELEVIEDVDRQAFISMAEEYFNDYYTGDDLEFYQSIRATAGSN
ncbi:TRAP transporter substrate-binding protein DctP [Leucobacter sp. Psy1]|uniref:TRAP transporter substrate-binding protein DctP n=1 Tax=Leucobacter sp. Psy1 TaxID=2875729 RepID=UPI001CD2BC10|nr:TRAP transporter substrate-binding protein DctP [Leucobacter sp. Psy1]